MSGPTKGGISPSTVAMPTSHGSSIRRRASLKTQNAVASQKTTTKNAARLRSTVHVLWLKKPKSPFAATVATRVSSEKELPDEIPGAEREADDRQNDDDGNREDAQALAELPHGTC